MLAHNIYAIFQLQCNQAIYLMSCSDPWHVFFFFHIMIHFFHKRNRTAYCTMLFSSSEKSLVLWWGVSDQSGSAGCPRRRPVHPISTMPGFCGCPPFPSPRINHAWFLWLSTPHPISTMPGFCGCQPQQPVNRACVLLGYYPLVTGLVAAAVSRACVLLGYYPLVTGLVGPLHPPQCSCHALMFLSPFSVGQSV